MKKKSQSIRLATSNEPLRIDIGCGQSKREGFIGVDQYAMPGVDIVCDVRFEKLPWADSTVDEVHCSHFLEHLQAQERVRFMNELYRVMKLGAKMTIIVPHWCSNRAYGDMTHCWPPVSEMWFYYLSSAWRAQQVPHTDIKYNKNGYSCDFEASWGYNMHPAIAPRNQEYQHIALAFWKEAAQDIHATLVKK